MKLVAGMRLTRDEEPYYRGLVDAFMLEGRDKYEAGRRARAQVRKSRKLVQLHISDDERLAPKRRKRHSSTSLPSQKLVP